MNGAPRIEIERSAVRRSTTAIAFCSTCGKHIAHVEVADEFVDATRRHIAENPCPRGAHA